MPIARRWNGWPSRSGFTMTTHPPRRIPRCSIPREAFRASIAAKLAKVPMQLDHVARPGSLVQRVDVLRDDGERRDQLREFHDRTVAGIWLDARDAARTREIPGVGLGEVRGVPGWIREAFHVLPRPESVRARAIRRDSTLGGNAGAGEHHDRFRAANQRRRIMNLLHRIRSATTPSFVILTGMIIPRPSKRSSSMLTTRWSRSVSPSGRRW